MSNLHWYLHLVFFITFLILMMVQQRAMRVGLKSKDVATILYHGIFYMVYIALAYMCGEPL